MTIKRAAVTAFLAMTLPATAQDVRFDLVDSGVLTHPSHGKGIEMRITPNPASTELFKSDSIDDLLLVLCKHYAPHVIPYIRETLSLEDPEFISVRLTSGGSAFGRYALEYYAISKGTCGAPL